MQRRDTLAPNRQATRPALAEDEMCEDRRIGRCDATSRCRLSRRKSTTVVYVSIFRVQVSYTLPISQRSVLDGAALGSKTGTVVQMQVSVMA